MNGWKSRLGWLVGLVIGICFLPGCAKESAPLSLRLGIPYSDNVQNLESNYYLNWIEEKSGVDIIPVEIRQTRCEEYLENLASSDTEIDIVLFGNSFVPSEEYLDQYHENGYIYTASNGDYVYRDYGDSVSSGCGQVLWINSDYLSALSLEIPQTTDEFEDMLRAFKERDPNGNGLKDEIPLLGSMDEYALNPLYYMMNAYIYCDPYHSLFSLENGEETFVPETPEFACGVEYCRKLYRDGLIDDRLFTYSTSQLTEMVNSPENIVGAFTSDSIGEVIYQGNPEIMAKYICVLPLKGPEGERNTLYVSREPSPGAVIINGTGKEAECEKLLDIMMSPEASLIARFGEPGVDWGYSDGLDVSIYGEKAKISTINYIWNSPQNKHLNGIGPKHVPEELFLGVTWNGINSDMEYIDARAKMSYQPYLPVDRSSRVYDEKIVKEYEQEWISLIKGEEGTDE
ncbi:MAG: extracellular solute-binding protein [Lachnospiraceae bacterium]|nr:extracellular solute-binding protein [Candidatus Merdinaster equi]